MFADVDHVKHQHKQLLTMNEYDSLYGTTESLFVDPDFAAVVSMVKSGVKPLSFTPDMLMEPSVKLDFHSYFTTNPELIKRGIGLDPEAFKDFQFAQPAPAK